MICENADCLVHVLERDKAKMLTCVGAGMVVGVLIAATGDMSAVCRPCFDRFFEPFLKVNNIAATEMSPKAFRDLVRDEGSHLKVEVLGTPKGPPS